MAVGRKDSKPEQYHTIPVAALRELAKLYAKGAAKYDDPYNFQYGYDRSLTFNALNRHLWQYWGGDSWDIEVVDDVEWVTHHMAAVAWHALTILMQDLDPFKYGIYDDRPEAEREDTEMS